MSERKDGNLKEVLSMVQDMIANGEVPDESNDAMAALVSGYGHALNEAECPCGSGKKYAECCKREYQAAVRGVKGLKKEQDSRPEEEAPEKAADEPRGDVKWCCRVGVDNKTGEPVTDVTGMAFDEPGITPQRIAGLLIAAYHDLMASGAFMLANGVYNRVMQDLGAVRAGAKRKTRPANRPVK